MKPLAIELFCGCFGGTAGWLEAGGYSVGFDLQHEHYHGKVPAGADLVLQDVLTLHGSQFKDASYIWASPPCQKYSYLAMPWSRSSDPENSKAAKALRKKWETEGPDNRLFDACFRIQREACEAAGRYIPLIVENVRGAVPWVGPAKAKFGSFYLWGDVGMVGNRVFAGRDLTDVMAGRGRFGMGVAPETSSGSGTWFEGNANNPDSRHNGDGRFIDNSGGLKSLTDGQKVPGFRFDGSGRSFQSASVAIKTPGRSLSKGAPNKFGTHNMGSAEKIFAELGADKADRIADFVQAFPAETQQAIEAGTKIGGDWFSDPNSTCQKHGSRSNARKAASAMIAKIPYALSRYIAEQHFPADLSETARVG